MRGGWFDAPSMPPLRNLPVFTHYDRLPRSGASRRHLQLRWTSSCGSAAGFRKNGGGAGSHGGLRRRARVRFWRAVGREDPIGRLLCDFEVGLSPKYARAGGRTKTAFKVKLAPVLQRAKSGSVHSVHSAMSVLSQCVCTQCSVLNQICASHLCTECRVCTVCGLDHRGREKRRCTRTWSPSLSRRTSSAPARG